MVGDLIIFGGCADSCPENCKNGVQQWKIYSKKNKEWSSDPHMRMFCTKGNRPKIPKIFHYHNIEIFILLYINKEVTYNIRTFLFYLQKAIPKQTRTREEIRK